MASILDRYGIKEVADVTFYTINESTGMPDKPVLFLDTLKVSTIEETSEQTDARGGKGNPKLITWDYGKEMTVTLEDALFSPKSLSIMLGDGTVEMPTAAQTINRVAVIRATSTQLPDYFVGDFLNAQTNSSERKKIYMGAGSPPDDTYVDFEASGITLVGVFKEDGSEVMNGGNHITDSDKWVSATAVSGNKYFVKYTLKGITKTINVGADSFPGTYYVTGDTYARSDVTGNDQFFQFIIPKAKVSTEQTITLEAEGDPSTFNMKLTVLRPEDGNMMKLVQYDLAPAQG